MDVVDGLLVLGGGLALVVMLVAEVEEEPGGGGALPLVVEPMSPHLMLEKVAWDACQSCADITYGCSNLRQCRGCSG